MSLSTTGQRDKVRNGSECSSECNIKLSYDVLVDTKEEEQKKNITYVHETPFMCVCVCVCVPNTIN